MTSPDATSVASDPSPAKNAVKAEAPLPYATAIGSRKPRFKPHRNMGQVQNAVCHYLRFSPDRLSTYRSSKDGVFTEHMTVYRLNRASGEYEPWIEIRKGDRRSKYPDLMPQRAKPDPDPDDPDEHTVKVQYRHTLECPATLHLNGGVELPCRESWHWMDDHRVIHPAAMTMLRRSLWSAREGKWYCPRHGGGQ